MPELLFVGLAEGAAEGAAFAGLGELGAEGAAFGAEAGFGAEAAGFGAEAGAVGGEAAGFAGFGAEAAAGELAGEVGAFGAEAAGPEAGLFGGAEVAGELPVGEFSTDIAGNPLASAGGPAPAGAPGVGGFTDPGAFTAGAPDIPGVSGAVPGEGVVPPEFTQSAFVQANPEVTGSPLASSSTFEGVGEFPPPENVAAANPFENAPPSVDAAGNPIPDTGQLTFGKNFETGLQPGGDAELTGQTFEKGFQPLSSQPPVNAPTADVFSAKPTGFAGEGFGESDPLSVGSESVTPEEVQTNLERGELERSGSAALRESESFARGSELARAIGTPGPINAPEFGAQFTDEEGFATGGDTFGTPPQGTLNLDVPSTNVFNPQTGLEFDAMNNAASQLGSMGDVVGEPFQQFTTVPSDVFNSPLSSLDDTSNLADTFENASRFNPRVPPSGVGVPADTIQQSFGGEGLTTPPSTSTAAAEPGVPTGGKISSISAAGGGGGGGAAGGGGIFGGGGGALGTPFSAAQLLGLGGMGALALRGPGQLSPQAQAALAQAGSFGAAGQENLQFGQAGEVGPSQQAAFQQAIAQAEAKLRQQFFNMGIKNPDADSSFLSALANMKQQIQQQFVQTELNSALAQAGLSSNIELQTAAQRIAQDNQFMSTLGTAALALSRLFSGQATRTA